MNMRPLLTRLSRLGFVIYALTLTGCELKETVVVRNFLPEAITFELIDSGAGVTESATVVPPRSQASARFFGKIQTLLRVKAEDGSLVGEKHAVFADPDRKYYRLGKATTKATVYFAVDGGGLRLVPLSEASEWKE